MTSKKSKEMKEMKDSFVANGSSYRIIVRQDEKQGSSMKTLKVGAGAGPNAVFGNVEVEKFPPSVASEQAVKAGIGVAIGEVHRLVGKGKYADIQILGLSNDEPTDDGLRRVRILPGRAIIVTKQNSTPYSGPLTRDSWDEEVWITEDGMDHRPKRFYFRNRSGSTLLVKYLNGDKWFEQEVRYDPDPKAFGSFEGTRAMIFKTSGDDGKYHLVDECEIKIPRSTLTIDKDDIVTQSPQITGRAVDTMSVHSLAVRR